MINHLLRYLLVFSAICFLPQSSFATMADDHDANKWPNKWEGVWFTCEFAQRQRAPDDACQMFDDEGFLFENGALSYLRMTGSPDKATDTAIEKSICKGNKSGQCFPKNAASINVTQKPVADIRIEDDRLIVRYWGCEQSYMMDDGADYMTIKPVNKNCLWSQERHFYIAPYQGKMTIVKK